MPRIRGHVSHQLTPENLEKLRTSCCAHYDDGRDGDRDALNAVHVRRVVLVEKTLDLIRQRLGTEARVAASVSAGSNSVNVPHVYHSKAAYGLRFQIWVDTEHGIGSCFVTMAAVTDRTRVHPKDVLRVHVEAYGWLHGPMPPPVKLRERIKKAGRVHVEPATVAKAVIGACTASARARQKAVAHYAVDDAAKETAKRLQELVPRAYLPSRLDAVSGRAENEVARFSVSLAGLTERQARAIIWAAREWIA